MIRRPLPFRNIPIARITASLALALLFGRTLPAAGTEDPRRRLAELRREMNGAHPPADSQASSRLNDIGVEYLEAGDPARAIELLSEAAGRDPDNGVALANLILAYLKHEDFEFAEFYLERATETVERRNPDPRIYLLIGELYAVRNRLEEALSAWDYYRRLGGSDAAALARLERTRRELSVTPGQRLLESEHFTLYTDETISAEEATQAEAYLEEEYRRHAAFFATELPDPQVVILYGGRSYFSLVSVPDWVSGVFDGKIRVSLDPDRGVTPQLQNVLSHELAHAMIRFASRDRAPGWLQEGLAQWCEGRRILRRELREVSRGRFPESLAALEARFGRAADRAAARSSYAQALGLVEYLIARHGPGAVVCLVQRLGEGLSVPGALRAEIGVTPEQLLAGWRSWAGL